MSTFSYPKKNSNESSTEIKSKKLDNNTEIKAKKISESNEGKKTDTSLQPSSNSSTSNATASASTATNESVNELKSIIDKSWREGVDYFKVESSIVCHDGESIQGSHVTSHEGIYILQWKFYDKFAHTHLSPLDTLTAAATTHVHKAKVMYYYETLNSADY